jgi:cation diffusion facilitator CzcD-associated flavoprotein CzcO
VTGDQRQSVRVAIIGAGAGGIGLGMLLLRSGIDDFVILEKAAGVGGTWRVNTYPGAECDVPSHLYSYSFQLNPDWSKTFSGQREILAYFERCTDESGLRPHIRTSTGVESVTWDASCRRWIVRTQHGDEIDTQVVVSAVGMFNAPAWPDIEGLDEFAGAVMHSARWDHDVGLAGRRVGVIGTGASAIQIVPAIASEVDHLDVYQRSAAWMMPRNDRPFSPEERRRFATDLMATRRHRHEIYRFYEDNTMFLDDDPRATAFERYALEHLRNSVSDPTLRDALTPDYPVGCKRILLSDDFYPAIQRSNVELVTDPIERATQSGLLTAGGVEHPLDVIVLATGYQATAYLHGLDVVGRDGRRLHDEWSTEPRAYLGMAVPGYPNFFVFYGPNTNQGGNSILIILEAQARYVLQALNVMDERSIDVLEVTKAAADAYNKQLDDDLSATVWVHCSSYFRTATGHIATQLPHPSSWYRRRARRLELDDYRVD